MLAPSARTAADEGFCRRFRLLGFSSVSRPFALPKVRLGGLDDARDVGPLTAVLEEELYAVRHVVWGARAPEREVVQASEFALELGETRDESWSPEVRTGEALADKACRCCRHALDRLRAGPRFIDEYSRSKILGHGLPR